MKVKPHKMEMDYTIIPDKCPRCLRLKKTFLENMFGTTECQCGMKFYHVKK